MTRSTIFFIGAAVGFAISAAWFLGASVPNLFSEKSHLSSTKHSPSELLKESNAVSIRDQSAGMTVVVGAVTVSGVWVAVHEMTAGNTGNILGAALTREPVSEFIVPLLRATEPGRTYAVVLYRDDGDGAFDHTKDSVYVDFETGERVAATFKTFP